MHVLDSAQCGSLPLFRPHRPCLHRVILRRGGGHLVLCPVKDPRTVPSSQDEHTRRKRPSPTKSLYEEVLLFAVWDVDFSSSHHLGYVLHLPAEFRERRRPSSPREPSGLPRLLSPSLLPPPPLFARCRPPCTSTSTSTLLAALAAAFSPVLLAAAALANSHPAALVVTALAPFVCRLPPPRVASQISDFAQFAFPLGEFRSDTTLSGSPFAVPSCARRLSTNRQK